MRAAGIDLGGTKIAACLFDNDWSPRHRMRVSTPVESYDAMIAAVAGIASDLRDRADDPVLPVGIGMPGVVHPETGKAMTANLPATGRTLIRDLKSAIGGAVTCGNDCRFFALSEAMFGAGRGAGSVFGLILGTGVAGGFVSGGALLNSPGDVSGEIGHLALPAALVMDHDLPLLTCGCGRRACYETLASGPGLRRIHARLSDADLPPEDIFTQQADGDTAAIRSVSIWHDILGELATQLHLSFDPEVIVLGGGLSNAPGLVHAMTEALSIATLRNTRPPKILLAEFGDDSGVRGAAYAAWSAAQRQAA